MIAALAGVSLSGCGGGGTSSGQSVLPADLMMTFELPIDGGNGSKVMFATTSFNESYQCQVYTNSIVYSGGTSTSGSATQIVGNYQAIGFDYSTGACSSLNVKWTQPTSLTEKSESSVTMYDCILPVASNSSDMGSVGRWNSLISYKVIIGGVETWPYEPKTGTGGIIYRGYDSSKL